jgi:hypothetical protein
VCDGDSVRSQRQGYYDDSHRDHDHFDEEDDDLTLASGVMGMSGEQPMGGLNLAVIEDFYHGTQPKEGGLVVM